MRRHLGAGGRDVRETTGVSPGTDGSSTYLTRAGGMAAMQLAFGPICHLCAGPLCRRQ
jgi:hypothetical protein